MDLAREIRVSIEDLFPCNCYRAQSRFGGHSRYCQSNMVAPVEKVVDRIIREVIEDIREGLNHADKT